MNASDLSGYLADSPPSVVPLDIEKHFDALSPREKRYAHFISKASFAGQRVVLRQVSPESEHVYDFILALHDACGGDWPSLAAKAGLARDDVAPFLEYAAQFLGNSGNYKGFGDSKFVPRCRESAFAALAATSPDAERAYRATAGRVFSVDDPALLHLGYPDAGHMSTYYPDSPGITQDAISAVSKWLEAKGLLPENTRLRQPADGAYEVLIASARTTPPPDGGDIGKDLSYVVEDGPLKGKTIKLAYGDHAPEMARIAAFIRRAGENAGDNEQVKLHQAYEKSFNDGSMLAFKESQRHWIRDKGPMVESNIGFIETYRDPAGTKGEWEGFAAMVNKEQTRAFAELVAFSPTLVKLLPWGKEFEKDHFLAPDFTSLEVLAFCGSGIPAGINIPNFDDIRQEDGFKNVSLGNVLRAKAPNEKIPFISEVDLPVFRKYRDPAFEVQVGLHELTGHGCGKLLQETSPGKYNFDHDSPPVSPVTDKPITTWYKPGQTWGSLFGGLASSYEECRAELVAMYLSCEFSALKIFGHGDGSKDMAGEAGDVLYSAYLSMARSGLISLEMWDPKSHKWGQAHSRARFSILQCFLQAGDDFCKLDYEKDDLSDLTIKLDRSKILSSGRNAVRDYLQKLHIFKVTADVAAGTDFYESMTRVDPAFWGSTVRSVVLRNRQPRKVFVQANTFLDDATGDVSIRTYEPSLDGMIRSCAEREDGRRRDDGTVVYTAA